MANPQRCCLCQFEISREDVVTESKYGRLRNSPSYSYLYLYTVWEYSFLRSCHRHCLDMIRRPNPQRLAGIAEAMKYEYIPSSRQMDIRHRKIRSLLSTELLTHFAHLESNLPLELWSIVAEYLLPYFASANLQRLWSPTPEPSCANISRAIWCKYVDLEGSKYIAAFSNDPSSNNWELIFQPSGELIVDIFVGGNHFGITKLLFSSSHNSPDVDEAEGIWWRKVHIEGSYSSIRGFSDGIKLRHLMNVDKDITAWSVPKSDNVRFEHLSPSFVTTLPARMASLDCNCPAIVGYSILWECGLVTIHVHRSDGDRFESKQTQGESSLPVSILVILQTGL
ncbi:hypothetical protein ACSS6W_008590 [Trichoderma asperelloides]